MCVCVCTDVGAWEGAGRGGTQRQYTSMHHPFKFHRDLHVEAALNLNAGKQTVHFIVSLNKQMQQ